jgi:2-iminobutanoate/2-iminopropanoate deaminase
MQQSKAPSAIGPYSPATSTQVGGRRMIFCSGQIAIDPDTGALIEGDVAAQTRRCLDNLGAVLEAEGAQFADIVKTTIYLANMDDFATVNAVYGERFSAKPPARATVQAARLPRDAKVEIDAVAIV